MVVQVEVDGSQKCLFFDVEVKVVIRSLAVQLG